MALLDLPTLAGVQAARAGKPVTKGVPRMVDRCEYKRQRAQIEQACRKAVRRRDKGVCRICGKPAVHLHHLQMRSLGGKWTVGNVLSLDAGCHAAVHGHVLILVGRPDASRVHFEWRGIAPPRGVARVGISVA